MVGSDGSDSTGPAPTEPGAQPVSVDAPPVAVPDTRAAAARARVAKLRSRAEATTAGEVHRRMTELDVVHQAAILSALAMVLIVPALVTLAAVLPVGSEHGFAASWGRHAGLDAESSADVRKLFTTDNTVQSSTTAFSSLFTIVSAYAWPAELMKSYRMIWGLPRHVFRDLWRPIVWIPSLFVVDGAVVAVGSIASGVSGAVLTGLLGLPVLLGWTWWTQHFLLAGRVRWRALLPGALAITLALFAASVITKIWLPIAVTSNYDRYGPIGLVFVIMSWLTIFSLVMLGGALVGHTMWRRRGGADSPDTPVTVESAESVDRQPR